MCSTALQKMKHTDHCECLENLSKYCITLLCFLLYDSSLMASCVQIQRWFDYRNHICIVSTNFHSIILVLEQLQFPTKQCILSVLVVYNIYLIGAPTTPCME